MYVLYGTHDKSIYQNIASIHKLCIVYNIHYTKMDKRREDGWWTNIVYVYEF